MSFNFFDLFWIFLIISFILPVWQKTQIQTKRLQAIKQLELQRQSRVILLIHRQESVSFLGVPLSRYISIEDSEQVLRAIRLTSEKMPIDIILHTPGGLVLATEQIAKALIRHEAKVSVFIPHYAMSGGTMIALASDEIVMDPNAVLGPVDPQLNGMAAASILKVLEQKPVSEIDDQTLMMADLAAKAIDQVQNFVRILLKDDIPRQKISPKNIDTIIDNLTTGKITHDCPITVEQAQELGLPVNTDFPAAIYNLMDLYPQAPTNRPSVQYIPLNYQPGQTTSSD